MKRSASIGNCKISNLYRFEPGMGRAVQKPQERQRLQTEAQGWSSARAAFVFPNRGCSGKGFFFLNLKLRNNYRFTGSCKVV